MGKKSLSNPYRTIAALEKQAEAYRRLLVWYREALAQEQALRQMNGYAKWNALATDAYARALALSVISAIHITPITFDAPKPTGRKRMDGLDWVMVVGGTMVLVGVAIMVISHVVA